MKSRVVFLIFISSLVLTSSLALAEDSNPPAAATKDASKAQNFEAAKKEREAMIEKQLTDLQKHKVCISDTKKWDDLAVCRDKMQKMRMGWKQDHMGMKKMRRQKRMDGSGSN